MSLTAEQLAQREWEMMFDPDKVRIEVPISWRGNLPLPDPEGNDTVTAVFKAWTFGDNWIVERVCRYNAEREDGKTVEQTDLNEFRRAMLKRGLLEWSLDIPIERAGGWLTPGCYRRVGLVSSPLIEAIIFEYELSMSISKEEEESIERQSVILFGQSSRGVSDACEAVTMFCTWGNFSEKFGIDKDKLKDLPYKEYVMLKMMMGKESDATRRNNVSKGNTNGRPRIATGGGRIRQDTAKRIPM